MIRDRSLIMDRGGGRRYKTVGGASEVITLRKRGRGGGKSCRHAERGGGGHNKF